MDGERRRQPVGRHALHQPDRRTGLVRAAEAARQVMNRAGAMQVPNVHNALATAIGGSTQFFTVTMLSDEPRRAAAAA